METLDLHTTLWRYVKKIDLIRAANAGGGDDPGWEMVVRALPLREAILLVITLGGHRPYVPKPECFREDRLTVDAVRIARVVGMPALKRIVREVGGTYVYIPSPRTVFQATAARMLQEGWPPLEVRAIFGLSGAELKHATQRFLRKNLEAEVVTDG